VHDELGERPVHGVVGQGEVLGDGPLDPRARQPAASRGHELLRRVDGGHRRRTQPRHQLLAEGTGAAPHVQRPLPGPHVGASAISTASGREKRPMNRS
jgi:hypothetical protein